MRPWSATPAPASLLLAVLLAGSGPAWSAPTDDPPSSAGSAVPGGGDAPAQDDETSEPDPADGSAPPDPSETPSDDETAPTDPSGASSADDDAPAGAPEPTAPEEPYEEVVVTASRRETKLGDATRAAQVISREEIEASGADTVAELLETRAGIQVQRSFRGAGVSMRGHQPDHVLVLLDGMRIPGRTDGVLDLQRLQTDDIERIEITPGAGSALWGSDALGGVIHLISRQAREGGDLQVDANAGGFVGQGLAGPDNGSPDAGLGALDHLDASAIASVARGKWAFKAMGSALLADPWTRTPDEPGTVGNGFRIYEGGLQATWRPTETTSLQLQGNYQSRDAIGTDANAAGAVIDRLNRTETAFGSARLSVEPHPRHALSTLVGVSTWRDQFREDQRGSDALDDFEEASNLTAQLQVVDAITLPKGHAPTFGFEGQIDRATTPRIEGGEALRGRLALFALHTWRVTQVPRLQLEPAIRGDYDTQFGGAFNPRLAVRFDPVGWVRIRGGVGTAFRAPDIRELYLRFDNPGANYRVQGTTDLQPERSVGGTLDVELLPVDAVTITASAWYDDLSNLIQTALLTDATPSSPSVFTYDNVARARIAGTSLTVAARHRRIVTASASYTFTDARDLTLGQPLQNRAAHQGNATLHGVWERTGLDGTVRASILGPRPFSFTEEGEPELVAAPNVQLDLRVGLALQEHLSLYAGVDNLLDAGDPLLDPLRPRRIYGGLTARLAPPRTTPETR